MTANEGGRPCRDDTAAGLAAVEARLDAMDDRLEAGFANLREVLDAKLDPLIQGAGETRQAVLGLGERVTKLEMCRDAQVLPAVAQTWKTQKDVAQLQEHAKRCDERSHTSSSLDRHWQTPSGNIFCLRHLGRRERLGWLARQGKRHQR